MWSVMSDQTRTLKTACRCAQFCMLRMSVCVVSFLFTLSTMVSMKVLKVYLSLYTLLRSHLFVNCCIRRYYLYALPSPWWCQRELLYISLQTSMISSFAKIVQKPTALRTQIRYRYTQFQAIPGWAHPRS